MDKRATHSLTGTVDVDSAVTAEAPAHSRQPVLDDAGAHQGADLNKILRAIAARLDVVLDEKVAAGAEPEGRNRAVRAWSSVIAKRATETTSDLRRHALATTVLRISADGRVDVDGQQAGVIDDAGDDAGPSEARPIEAPATPQAVEVAPVHDVTPEPPAAAATDRSDVEDRLRAVRERLATRRASATAERVDAPIARAPRVHGPVWRRADMRSVVQRLLIGLAIVGASAVVSILIT